METHKRQDMTARERVTKIGRDFLIALPYNIVFCTIIAILFTLFRFAPAGKSTSFLHNLVFSQCIGSLCCLFSITSHNLIRNSIIRVIGHGMALALGTVSGALSGCLLLGLDPMIFAREFGFFLKILFGTMLFGSIIIYFWHTHEKLMETKTMAQDERIRRLTSEKEAVETNLRLLQAQIEPHFLFNTLSNILSLLETDTKKGQSMLADLTHYLRTSLSKTRKNVSTLGQEMEMVRGYLKIFKVRMGDRLQYKVEIPDDLKDAPLSPMIVQPLVENAIRHGLEPKVGGGAIDIRAYQHKDRLVVAVADTGLGMQGDHEPGTGLNNIRERLKSLYGDRGRLTLQENDPTGVKAIIEVPHETG